MKAKASPSPSGASRITSRNRRRSSAPALGRVQDQSGHHLGPDGVKPKLERGDHAEAAAASAQRPEQLAVLVLGGADQLALAGHQLGRDQVVAGEAVLALEPARAAAQGEPAHAGRGHPPAGGRQAVDLRLRGRPRPRWPRRPHAPRAARRSTSTSHMARRSSTRPSSQSERPLTEWPPARTAISSPCSCANASDAITSSGAAQRATSRGRRTIIELNSVHASAYSGSPGS